MSNLYANPASTADETTQYITAKLRAGASPAAIVESLVAGGWSHSDADTAVESTARLLQRQGGIPAPAGPSYPQSPGSTYTPSAGTPENSAAHKAASRLILRGCLWCVGGLVMTAISYSAAADGGTYFVFTGAIIWGLVDVVRGLILQITS